MIGRVYEYFLKEFAVNATKEEGEFYTSHDVVQLITTMIEPYDGMFIQSAELVKSKQGDIDKINIWSGKRGSYLSSRENESCASWTDHNLGETNNSSFTHDLHKGLYFNYIMANERELLGLIA